MTYTLKVQIDPTGYTEYLLVQKVQPQYLNGRNFFWETWG